MSPATNVPRARATSSHGRRLDGRFFNVPKTTAADALTPSSPQSSRCWRGKAKVAPARTTPAAKYARTTHLGITAYGHDIHGLLLFDTVVHGKVVARHTHVPRPAEASSGPVPTLGQGAPDRHRRG